MTGSEKYEIGLLLIFKINVITGWEVPESEAREVVLTDQFIKKLSESYANVNSDEVEYAFRNNTTVKDWGKTMNLAMIDEVMIPYLNCRRDLSEIEEKLKKPIKEPIHLPIHEMTDEQLLAATYQTFKIVKKHEFIPPFIYDYLVKQGDIILDNDQKREIKKKVENLIKLSIASDREFAQEYERIIDKEENLRTESKKFAVAIYFNSLILKGC